jgi:hypothetical protein
MNVMKILAAAATISMLGSAIASANTVARPQASDQSHLSEAKSASMTASDTPDKETTVVAGNSARQTAKPLGFANFGQWDESASEN